MTARQITAADIPAFTPTGGSESLGLAAWLAGCGRTSTPPVKAFWSDVDAAEPNVHRLRDRVFIGNGAGMLTARNGVENNSTIFSNDGATPGANWGPRDAALLTIHDRGGLAIVGASRSSDGPASISSIGVSGFVINDQDLEATWGLYSDVQHQCSGGFSTGLEVAAKNKGPDSTATPYTRNQGVFGVWLAGGGDDLYGGSPTNPSNTAIYVLKNKHTWNKGIVFGDTSLTGTDGTDGSSGSGVAMEMARKHVVQWLKPNGSVAGSIRSTVQNAGVSSILSFDNAGVTLADASGNAKVQANATGVGFFGTTPVGQQTGIGAALNTGGAETNTNLATRINQIRAALVALGLAA